MSEITADVLKPLMEADYVLHVLQMRYGGEFLAFLFYDIEEAGNLMSAIGGSDMEGSAMPYVFRSEAVLAGIGKNPHDALAQLYERVGEYNDLDPHLKNEWHELHSVWIREANKIADCQLRELSPQLEARIKHWKKRTTQIRSLCCDKEGCPMNRCECSCHEPSVVMMHMFACCVTQKCPKCGEVKHDVVADNGVYFKDKQQ